MGALWSRIGSDPFYANYEKAFARLDREAARVSVTALQLLMHWLVSVRVRRRRRIHAIGNCANVSAVQVAIVRELTPMASLNPFAAAGKPEAPGPAVRQGRPRVSVAIGAADSDSHCVRRVGTLIACCCCRLNEVGALNLFAVEQ